jgi:hypothetical protein
MVMPEGTLARACPSNGRHRTAGLESEVTTGINAVRALRQDHEDIRIGLRLVADKGPFLAAVAKRLRELCLPHFEFEERIIFPILDRLEVADPAKQEGAREQLSGLCRHTVDADHDALAALTSVLLVAAGRQGSTELRELAHLVARHERAENTLRAELRLGSKEIRLWCP